MAKRRSARKARPSVHWRPVEDFLAAERDLGMALASAASLQEALRACLRTAIAISGMDSGGIYFVADDGSLDLAYHEGLSPAFVAAVRRYASDSEHAQWVQSGKPTYVGKNDSAFPFTSLCREEGLRTLAAIPVSAAGKIVACLNVASHKRARIIPAARTALEDIAARIGAAIVRARAEESLRESQTLYADLVNNQSGGIYRIRVRGGYWHDIANPPYVYEYASESYCEMFGVTCEELQKHPEATLRQIHPYDLEDFLQRNEEAARALRSFFWEGRMIIRGQTRWIQFCACPRRISPAYVRWTGMATDITERKTLEERLHQAEKLEAIGRLAGGIAHDFNNQLTGIIGYAELLLRRLADERLRFFTEGILSAALRASDFAGQILSFARKGYDSAVAVDMHALIAETAHMLVHSLNKQIEIRQDLQSPVPWVKGDASRLQSVLLNLGLNARDAMPEGGVLTFATSLRCAPDAAIPVEMPAGDCLVLSVSDTGAGMDEEKQRHLFEPFFTTKERGLGTGLGLATVYATVRNHGGVITVKSEPGRGTTFAIYLPSASPPPAVSPDGSEAISACRPLHILLVDDEQVVRETTTEHLRSAGHVVMAHGDGAEAIKAYGSVWREIDLVILDLIMPRMSGQRVFAALREQSPSVKILLISGYSQEGEAAALLNAGAVGFLQKPFSRQALLQKVAECAAANRQ